MPPLRLSLVLGNTLTTLSEDEHDEGLRHRSGVESQTVVIEDVVCGETRGVSGTIVRELGRTDIRGLRLRVFGPRQTGRPSHSILTGVSELEINQ